MKMICLTRDYRFLRFQHRLVGEYQVTVLNRRGQNTTQSRESPRFLYHRANLLSVSCGGVGWADFTLFFCDFPSFFFGFLDFWLWIFYLNFWALYFWSFYFFGFMDFYLNFGLFWISLVFGFLDFLYFSGFSMDWASFGFFCIFFWLLTFGIL